MLKYTDEEKQEVIDYYLWQSPEGTEVKFAQKCMQNQLLAIRTRFGTFMQATADGGS